VSKFNIDAEKLKKAAPAYTEMQAPLPLLRGFGLWPRLRPSVCTDGQAQRLGLLQCAN
jgi:hypothetical protein